MKAKVRMKPLLPNWNGLPRKVSAARRSPGINGAARCRIALGCLAFLAGTATAAPPDAVAAIDRAQAHVQQHAAATFFDTDQELLPWDVIIDDDGTEHVRFLRRYKSLAVLGGDMVVHGTVNDVFLDVSQTLERPLMLSPEPEVSFQEAIRQAVNFFGNSRAHSKAELVVYARGIEPRLAYEVIVEGNRADEAPSELHVIVDASTAAVIDAWDGIETAGSSGEGRGFLNGSVPLTTNSTTSSYELRDPTRGGGYTVDMLNRQVSKAAIFVDTDNTWGDFTLSDRATVAADVQYGASTTWDYYRNVHGRHGVANDGAGALNRAHYSRNYNNAFWSDACFCMTYGDGDGRIFNPFTSLDVVGHETSHGVTSRTARLIYSGESGGLNEATSDIFGTMVEFYAGNASDPADYLIGEKLFRNGKGALRFMHQPSLDGASADCWYQGLGSLDVHYSSGVANHFFYLLAEGNGGSPASPTCMPGDQRQATGSVRLTGIGRDKAEKIWYRALTVYMTSNTDYGGARTATLSAAGDLYGASGPEVSAVAAAWSAVNVK